MKKHIAFIACFSYILSFSQEKKFTMEEAVLGLYTDLAVENINQLQWLPEQSSFVYTVKTSYGEALLKKEAPTLKVDTLLSTSFWNNPQIKNLPYLHWLNDKQAYFSSMGELYTFSFGDGKPNFAPWVKLPEEAENVEVHKETKQIAYVVDNNLVLLNSRGEKHLVTTDGKYEIVNGKTVHQQEFGIEKGIFFSPKGNYLAFYRMDQSMVEDYPIPDWHTTPATVKNIKYPFAGRTSHQVTLGVYDPSTKKTVFIQTGEPKEQFLTSVSWSPDEKSIFIGILDRAQKHFWLNQYDIATGKMINTLFEETNDKYVHPQHELYFLPNKTDEFVWRSQRDGFMHLYRYNTKGKLLNQITKGNWLVNDIVGLNERNKTLFITTTKDSPMEVHLYSVNWENGKLEKLDTAAGTHHVQINTSGEYVLDTWSNDTTPRKIEVYATDKKWKQGLLTAADPLTEYKRPKVENINLKADDGTDLYGKLIYPTNFDPKKKYPVIVYLYGGPGAQLLSNSYPASENLWYEYLAQNGYVVFTMDSRGSSNRGLKFEQAVFRNFGDIEMDDQMKGVDFLKSKAFINTDKMGIHGWSFGGFMTTSFMLRKPDVFKVGVAGGPVLDWSMYEIMYTERYMDTPQNNTKGYDNANLMNKTDQLKGKLLIIHGASDNIVLWQHSINFLKNAVDKGKQLDYFIYPGHEHNIRGKDRVHLMQKVTDYFDLYLK